MALPSLTLARRAMATRFELVLFGDRPEALRAAGEEALDEIERLEAQLSLYRASSELAHLNARAGRESVRVEPGLFELLVRARELHHQTRGAFDVTIGPLMRCWGFVQGRGRRPSPRELAAARALTGMRLIELNRSDCTVRFQREGVMLDLGAIGKGYAIEQALLCLTEAGVTRALLHGGTSTVAALGAPPDQDAWKVGIELPSLASAAGPEAVTTESASFGKLRFGATGTPDSATQAAPGQPDRLAVVPLQDAALSVSAWSGKYFEQEGKTYGHVIDPRTGQPAAGATLAAVVCDSATDADALSTALLTLGIPGWADLVAGRPRLKAVVWEAGRGAEPGRFRAQGISLTAAGGAKDIGAGTENRN